jgi:hypothetical protein
MIGKIGAVLKDGDHLICELTGFDVWLEASLMFESPINLTRARIDLKVEKSMEMS